MRRVNRYRGRRPRGGPSGGQVILAALVMLVAMLALTIHASGQWTGMSAREQLYQAVFAAKDWD